MIANTYTLEPDAYLRSEGADEYEPKERQFKKVLKDDTNGRTHIAMFDFRPRENLPIKRIIVGPHVNKGANAEKAKDLVGSV